MEAGRGNNGAGEPLQVASRAINVRLWSRRVPSAGEETQVGLTVHPRAPLVGPPPHHARQRGQASERQPSPPIEACPK